MTLSENLRALFRVESQLRGLRSRLESAERYLKAQTSQLETIRHQQEELEARRRQAQAAAGNLEMEMKSIDERVEKLREELNAAVNNKQYSALLNELNTIKINRNEVEERVIDEMERIEQFEAQIVEFQEQADEREKVRHVAERQLHERRDEIGDRLTELEGEREKAASVIPTTELDVFNEIADIYDGEAMAPIEEVSRRHREYACGACNMQMPFDSVSQLVTGVDALVRCTACGRILFMQEETRGTLAKK